jgi:hypothetical protein
MSIRLFLGLFLALSFLGLWACSSTSEVIVLEPDPTLEMAPKQDLTAEKLFLEALQLQKQQKHPLALSKYGEALQAKPDYIKARLYQAGCQFELEKYPSCQENLALVFEAPDFAGLSKADQANAYRLKGQLLYLQAKNQSGNSRIEALKDSEECYRYAEELEER